MVLHDPCVLTREWPLLTKEWRVREEYHGLTSCKLTLDQGYNLIWWPSQELISIRTFALLIGHHSGVDLGFDSHFGLLKCLLHFGLSVENVSVLNRVILFIFEFGLVILLLNLVPFLDLLELSVLGLLLTLSSVGPLLGRD